MGNWKITIDGHGCHHNGKPEIDADLAAKEFVTRLKAQGHTVKVATMEMTDVNGVVVPSTTGITDLLAE